MLGGLKFLPTTVVTDFVSYLSSRKLKLILFYYFIFISIYPPGSQESVGEAILGATVKQLPRLFM